MNYETGEQQDVTSHVTFTISTRCSTVLSIPLVSILTQVQTLISLILVLVCHCVLLYRIFVDQLLLQHQTLNNLVYSLSQLQHCLSPKHVYLTWTNQITVTVTAISLKNMYLAENTALFP